jgi:hypothetical protein
MDMVDFILEFSVNECRLLLTVFCLWRCLEILGALLTVDVLSTKSLGETTPDTTITTNSSYSSNKKLIPRPVFFKKKSVLCWYYTLVGTISGAL